MCVCGELGSLLVGKNGVLGSGSENSGFSSSFWLLTDWKGRRKVGFGLGIPLEWAWCVQGLGRVVQVLAGGGSERRRSVGWGGVW